jgi:hypothetical protein
MHDPDVIADKDQWQRLEKILHSLSPFLIGQDGRGDFVGLVERSLVAEEPSVIGLLVLHQDVELVVAQDALGRPLGDEPGDQVDDLGAIGPAIDEVADEDQTSSFGVNAVGAIAEQVQQRLERIDLAMNVSDDINRPVEEWADKRIRHGAALW